MKRGSMNNIDDELSEIGLENQVQTVEQDLISRRCLRAACRNRFKSLENSNKRYCSPDCEPQEKLPVLDKKAKHEISDKKSQSIKRIRDIVFNEIELLREEQTSEDRLFAVCKGATAIIQTAALEIRAHEVGFDLTSL